MTSYKVDLASKMVVVIGDIIPFEVLESVSKVKNAELWSASCYWSWRITCSHLHVTSHSSQRICNCIIIKQLLWYTVHVMFPSFVLLCREKLKYLHYITGIKPFVWLISSVALCFIQRRRSSEIVYMWPTTLYKKLLQQMNCVNIMSIKN